MTKIEFYNSSVVDLMQTNATDDMVAMAAWVSNGHDEESRLKDRAAVTGLINYLIRNKHMSPLEHGSWTFKVTTPLFVAREFHRHRTMSYNEISGRYSEMEPRFYIPDANRPVVQQGKIGSYNFTEDAAKLKLVTKTLKATSTAAWKKYIELKEAGVANEVARMCLPLNLMTEFYATVNTRNLMHFLDLRQDPQALFEIRDVANQMAAYFSANMPITHDAWREIGLEAPEPVQQEKWTPSPFTSEVAVVY